MTQPTSPHPRISALPTTTPGPIAPTGAPTDSPAQVPIDRWDAILADLADRGVEAAPVVVSSEAVTWPDGSLGCPAPGMMYTQALVEGMRVVVTAGGSEYDYRFGPGDAPLLCSR